MDGGGSVKTISEETVILPVVVAGAVISELAVYLQGKGIVLKVGDELADKLADKAEHCYAKNSAFRKRLRSQANQGCAGRDWLYAFMRHWLSAEFPHGSEVYRNLPYNFCIGRKAA
jgi:hypothetical protein